MASKLVQSEVGTWYKRLNFVRTNEGGLSAIADQSASQTPLNAVSTLVNGVANTRTANAQLGVSDYGVTAANIASGKKIQETDKTAIDAAILSLLRICNNMTCQTVCTQTTMDTNGTKSNGSTACSHGACQQGTDTQYHYNGTCVNGYYLDGYYHSQTGYNNECYHSAHSQGSERNQVSCYQGTKTNGTCTNAQICPNLSETNGGCNHTAYDPATATYSNKNHYTEEQALNRV